jgi:hypothetical protein
MALEDIIDALDDYNDTSRNSMTLKSFTSLLWMVMIQCRHFTAGNMVPDEHDSSDTSTMYLPAFTSMTNMVRIAAPIVNGMVPPSLYNTPKAKTKREEETQTGHTAAKRPKITDDKTNITTMYHTDIYNAKMKTAMAPFLTRDRLPTVGSICTAAKTRSNELFPNNKQLCLRSQLWGQCNSACKFEHKKLPQTDIDRALKLLHTATTNPKLVSDKVRK